MSSVRSNTITTTNLTATFASESIEKPDVWTLSSTAINIVTSFVSNTYWLGGCIDLVSGLEDGGIGLSWWGLGFGAGLSLGIACMTGYADGVQNFVNQRSYTPSQANTPAPSADADEESSTESADTHPLVTERTPLVRSANLTVLQKIALGGYFFSYTGDNAGVLSFIAEIASNERLPNWGKGAVQGVATLIGAFGAIANTRTCKQSMVRYNNTRGVALVKVRVDQNDESTPLDKPTVKPASMN